jgi:hypothetical protein
VAAAERTSPLRLGIADHFGWAVGVTAAGFEVVYRRRIELVSRV